MSDRNPVVYSGGFHQELPATDSLALAGAPAMTTTARISTGQRTLAGREHFATRGSLWPEEAMQGRLDRLSVARWRAQGNAVTINAENAPALTAVGTPTARNVATTSMATRVRRVGAVSALTVGALAGWYSTVAQWSIGAGHNASGFFTAMRFIPSDTAAVSGARMFAGLTSSITAPTNVEPSALTNAIGVAAISTSANLQLVFGGSAAQAPADLGTNFPANGLSTDVYEMILHAPPGANANVGWRV